LRSKNLPAALVAAVLLCLTACTPDRDPASLFAPGQLDVPVVDALLVIDKPLPEILLSRTVAANVPFDLAAAAIRDADVRVVVAGSDTVLYEQHPVIPGCYWLVTDEPPLVQADTLYELLVVTDTGEQVYAATTTPAALVIDEWVLLDRNTLQVVERLRTFAELGDAVYDAPENQLVYTQHLLEGRLVEPRAAGTQVAVASLDLDADFVIDLPFLDDDDLAELERSGSSPALALDSDAVRLPWFAIFWEGRHVSRVLLLDRNAFDLVRTSPAFGGGFRFGGNAGDGFERPIFHVSGGIGLFGSAAMDSIGFTVLPLPRP
jgi:hypothetical protein